MRPKTVAGMTGRPHTGAWIETLAWVSTNMKSPVAPTRGRGSKQQVRAGIRVAHLSPPHGGVDRNAALAAFAVAAVGSPPHGGVDRNAQCDALCIDRHRRPHTGAWIETGCHLRMPSKN